MKLTKRQLRKLIQEASKRRQSLTRIGLRFGGSLASVQAERLRERGSAARGSDVAGKLAEAGAGGLERFAKIITDLDNEASKRR